MNFQIDKGIPIPKIRIPNRAPTYPWADMEVGDSILLLGHWGKPKTIANRALPNFKIWVRKERPELEFAYAKEGDDTRVWLCKPERKKRGPGRPRSADIPLKETEDE